MRETTDINYVEEVINKCKALVTAHLTRDFEQFEKLMQESNPDVLQGMVGLVEMTLENLALERDEEVIEVWRGFAQKDPKIIIIDDDGWETKGFDE